MGTQVGKRSTTGIHAAYVVCMCAVLMHVFSPHNCFIFLAAEYAQQASQSCNGIVRSVGEFFMVRTTGTGGT